MIKYIKEALKNTIVICFGMGVTSLSLLIIFTFLMDGKIICAIGLVILIVFIICLWNAYGERNDNDD